MRPSNLHRNAFPSILSIEHFLTGWFCVFVAIVASSQSLAQRDETPRHLFLDPSIIQHAENTSIHVNSPLQREIVIRADKSWEQLMISFYLTVLDDGGKLRMWYICRDKLNQPNVAYAESSDGVNWIKPYLGIVEYEGNTNNNLVGLSSLEGTVYVDERAPATERYCYITHLLTEGMVRFHSPDGLHWNRDAVPIVKFGADSQAVTFWDERVGRYALYLRGWEERADKKLYRKVVRADLPSLTEPLSATPSEKSRRLWGKEKVAVVDDELPQVLATDDRDPPDSDVYTISAQPYPLDRQWYLGFPSFFQREKSRSDGRLDVECIGSRDGFEWHRYDRAPYVKPGLAGTENANMVFIGPGLIVRGDEIWQYGTGFHSRHGDVAARKLKTDGVIYRYVQRVDGFVSLDFDLKVGECLTAPMKVSGRRLVLNLDTGTLGQLRVGLVDLKGKSIAGFSVDDCQFIRTNSTRALVTWKGGSDLAAFQEQDVHLTFVGSRAKLYSFRFVSDAH